MKYLLLLLCSTFGGHFAFSQTAETDTITNSLNKESDRNVMLNASDASKPREVNIGLPGTVGGTEIFEDGLPVVYYFWPHMPYMSWRGGVSYENTGLMSLSESALLSGNVGYTVMSESRVGAEKLGTHMNYALNHFGAQKFDLNIVGKLSKNWLFSLSSFQNFDPGSNDLQYLKYQDRTQIYKGALTYRWNEGRGEISLLLKHSNNISAADANGPFIYVGDGSVKPLDRFDLGRDSYMPSDGMMRYQDIVSGDTLTQSLYDMNHTHANLIGLSACYRFDNSGLFKFNMKYGKANTNWTSNALSGTNQVAEDRG